MTSRQRLSLTLVVSTLALGASRPPAEEPPAHRGMCDASAAVALGPERFVVANDEDNTLRVFERSKDGPAVARGECDLNRFLKAWNKKKEQYDEADIEGAAAVGTRVYWITSHGANKEGKDRPVRRRFFATRHGEDGDPATLSPEGWIYTGRIEDLAGHEPLKPFNLKEAAKKAPEGRDGLNIEGLAATPDGEILIGFRNPIPDGKSLIVPLKNPEELIKGDDAVHAKLGDPIFLDLNKMGIRDFMYDPDKKQYLIVAGPPGDNGDFTLFWWDGPGSNEKPESISDIKGKEYHPEAIVRYPAPRAGVQLLSDDGGVEINGKECKDCEPGLRKFRSFEVNF